MRFIVIDGYTQNHRDVEADTAEEAAQRCAEEAGLNKCLSPKLVEVNGDTQKRIKGARLFVDEATRDGWGPGCRFQGQTPRQQVILTVCPTEEV